MARNRFCCLACKPRFRWWWRRNFNYPDNRREDAQKLNETIGQIPQPVLITGICILICFVLLLIVLFAWLRARGRFIFVDCIVRNRAAIVEPWKEFRAEGNSFFLFSLLVVLVLIAVIVIAGLVTHCAVYPQGRSGTTGRRILDRPFAVRVCRGLPRFCLGPGLSIDGPNHVPATLSGAARVCPNGGPGILSSRADSSLRLISSAVGSRSGHDQLRGNMRDLLHRCDSVRRHSYTFAASSDARRLLAVVPSAVRSRLRCMGRTSCRRNFCLC